MEKRLTWAEYAKAIGIILVVYGHVARGVYNAGLPIDENIFKALDDVIYSFHMPLFFLLSGYFFMGSLKKWGRINLIKIKLSTIAYPYVIWSILQGSIEVLLNSYTNQAIVLHDILTLLYIPRAQFWFLYTLFIIFVFSTAYYQSGNFKFILGTFIIASILFIFKNEIPVFFKSNFFTSYFVFFAAGVLYSQRAEYNFLNSKNSLAITFLLFVGGQYLEQQYGYLISSILNHFVKLILIFISITFIICLSKFLSKTSNNLLLLIGQSSFVIYLLHVIFASGTRIIMEHFFNIISIPTHLLLGCFAGIFLPLIIAQWVKRHQIQYLFSFPLKNLPRKYSS